MDLGIVRNDAHTRAPTLFPAAADLPLQGIQDVLSPIVDVGRGEQTGWQEEPHGNREAVLWAIADGASRLSRSDDREEPPPPGEAPDRPEARSGASRGASPSP